jgi:uncharacterized phiE125 gp8 family phage protein
MLITVTAATVEPVTLAEAKAHLRVIDDSDDAMIGGMITSAREVVEASTGRALAAASYRWASERSIEVATRLPLWPISAVTAVSYLDGEVRRAVDDYTVDLDRSMLVLASPSGTALNVEFDTTPEQIPAALKAAILLLVGDLYENAEATFVGTIVAENPTVRRLIWPHRVNLGV